MMIDKSLITGSTTTLILKLLEERDMYGYQMIETLAKKSDDTFNLKAGTLYPILHNLEKEGMVESYEEKADGARIRKYYHLTSKGRKLLVGKKQEWVEYTTAVNKVLNGGVRIAVIG
ncbi:MAG TPA: PadR family transcriptional regulator [Lachnospiraceae bacterium]|nr:PadR family transcriptional regulator [Lachnospiraceae bacterium]HCA69329.1 PadR family transcriptional regulator [Lachnospiraceae bacterium]HCM12764.1 PadR family transcriptional regulator [Lachnospiraceae bacterium]